MQKNSSMTLLSHVMTAALKFIPTRMEIHFQLYALKNKLKAR
jgi:hypothetical protein